MIDWFISLSGKGGQKIREIQSESGAYIKVCKKVVTVERMLWYTVIFSFRLFPVYSCKTQEELDDEWKVT